MLDTSHLLAGWVEKLCVGWLRATPSEWILPCCVDITDCLPDSIHNLNPKQTVVSEALWLQGTTCDACTK